MTWATGIGTRIAAVRGCIRRVQEVRAYYRRLADDPDADRTAIEEARLHWKAWERELGSQADTILEILDRLQASPVSEAETTPRKPIMAAPAPVYPHLKKRRAHAG